jgi:hypothetical protein
VRSVTRGTDEQAEAEREATVAAIGQPSLIVGAISCQTRTNPTASRLVCTPIGIHGDRENREVSCD